MMKESGGGPRGSVTERTLQNGGERVRKRNSPTGPIRNRELSWLSFNERILQEASDPDVPLLERLKFLGIFSSNLDEFFRIRVAALRRLVGLGDQARKLLGADPRTVLKEIQGIVLRQHQRFDLIYADLTRALHADHIHLVSETQLDPAQAGFVRSYFRNRVRRHLMPLMLDPLKVRPALRDPSTYLAVELYPSEGEIGKRHALLEIPTHIEGRFIELPHRGEGRSIILLDDVIRFCLDDIFSLLGFERFAAYSVKITRDAELDLDDDLSQSLVKKLARSLKQRREGAPVRFTYDSALPAPFLKLLVKKLEISQDDAMIPGQRYHNFRDFIRFPDRGASRLRYRPLRPIPHPAFAQGGRLFDVLRKRDVLLHHPFHTFDHFIDLLREASIDPDVVSVKLTIYRAAKHSSVINALVNAARNGKAVTVVLELQARFDEEANLDWGQTLQDEGVHVIYGVPGLKVHAKVCQITRIEAEGKRRYAVVGTGNFNEDTSSQYSDHLLLTADPRITKDVSKVFKFCESNFSRGHFRHLWVSPFTTRVRLRKLIRNEIRLAREGKGGRIRLKMNNLTDPDLIRDLYRASQAGVSVQLLVRSMFSLIPGRPGLSERIEAKSIVDRFLEHSRVFIFGEGPKAQYFISSADLMARNLDQRLEVVCPLYDDELRGELETYFDLQWKDTVKARLLDADLTNHRSTTGVRRRAQLEVYRWLVRKGRPQTTTPRPQPVAPARSAA